MEFEAELPEVPPVPWEDGQRFGLPALAQTVGLILRRPQRFFANLPRQGGLGEPLGFALLLGTVGLLSRLCWQAVWEGAISGPLPEGLTALWWGEAGADPWVVWGLILMAPGYVTLGQFLVSAVLIAAGRFLGAAAGSFETVFRVVAYAQAAAVFSLLPWLGGAVASVGELALICIGLSETLHFSLSRAVFAVLLAGVLLTLALGLLLLPLAALGLWHLLSF
jgi:hypothetical protein